jgi:putative tricarboxylic transport membrane protein
MTLVSYLSKGSFVKALLMICFGLFLGTIGADIVSGKLRFLFGTLYLMDGVNLVPVCVGLFGISEVLLNVEQNLQQDILKTKLKGLFPTLKDWKDSIGPICRGSIIGFFLGILPGGGAVLASFFSYGIEKKISKEPEKFGIGAIQGVAGPESANNGATGGAFIPLLSLGIPSNGLMAVLLGALMIHGVHPGPLLMQRNPEIFWGIIASMYVGNFMLLLLNLPLIGIWVRILTIPYRILFPLILLFCLIGAYSVNNSVDDIFAVIIFGALGYLFRKLSFDLAPLILALVLGPILEYSFSQSLIIARGNILIFLERPISVVFLAGAAISLSLPLIPFFRRSKPKMDEGT